MARQAEGSGACGFLVAWHMEAELRRWSGDGWACMGWPAACGVQARIAAYVQALKLEEQKSLKEMELALQTTILAAAAAAKAKAAATMKVDGAAALAALAAKAKASASAGEKVEKLEPKVKKEMGFEDLQPAFQERVKKVQDAGVGVCSKCRWTYGCKDCDHGKALRYWLKQQFGE